MKKKVSIIFLITFLAVVSFFYFWSQNSGKITILNEKLNLGENLEEPGSTKNEAEPNAISIPAFSQKEFNGSDFKVGQVIDGNSSYTRYYVIYESGKLTISGIMNVPKGNGPFPVLFLNHGYVDPDVYTNGRGLKREQDYLAGNGYIVVHSDYRNHAGSDKENDPRQPDFRFGYAEDVINGILAIQKAELPYADTDKIGMLGHSLGGGVAEIIAVSRPELVDAIVLFAPVSADQKDNYEKWTKNDPERDKITIETFGSPENDPKFWREASPINYFDKVAVPVLFHHGTSDKDCAPEWSERAVKVLKDAGKDVTLYVYPGEPHEFVSAWTTVMKRTLDFFDKYVKE